jgi:hypothetical protein
VSGGLVCLVTGWIVLWGSIFWLLILICAPISGQ